MSTYFRNKQTDKTSTQSAKSGDKWITSGRLGLLVGSIALVVSIGQYIRQPARMQLGIVRTMEIMEKYQGAIDARTSFAQTSMQLRSNLDTLQAELLEMRNAVHGTQSTMSPGERQAREEALRLKEAQVRDFSAAADQRMAKEQETLTATVVSSVRQAAEQLGRNNGINVVFAIGDEGLVVFRDDAVDVTDEVLAIMKAAYNGELKSTSGQ